MDTRARINTQQLAKRWRVHPDTIRRYDRAGRLPRKAPARTMRWHEWFLDEIEALERAGIGAVSYGS